MHSLSTITGCCLVGPSAGLPQQQRGDVDLALLEGTCGMRAAVERRDMCSQVPAAHVMRLDITPDIDAGAVNITVLGSKAAEGAAAHVTVLDKHGKEVSQTSSQRRSYQQSLAASTLSASADFKQSSFASAQKRLPGHVLLCAGWQWVWECWRGI